MLNSSPTSEKFKCLAVKLTLPHLTIKSIAAKADYGEEYGAWVDYNSKSKTEEFWN